MKSFGKILASALLLVVAVAMLSGCGFIARNINGDIVISGGTLYEVNDRAELDLDGVNSIQIGGVSDEITILAGGSKVVAELIGQCRSAGDPVKLEARKDGSTLVIEVDYPNNMIRSNNTRLTVTIPEAFEGSLNANTVSGNITGDGLPFQLERVHLGAISGNIRFSTKAYGSLEAGTISGRVELEGIAAPVKAKTVSGEVSLAYVTPADTTVVTVSGGVRARLPQDAEFKVDFGSVSGSFRSSHSGLSATKAGGNFSGSVGEGEALIEVNTTSGNFDLEE